MSLPRATLRGWTVEQLGKMESILTHLLASATPSELRTYRDGGTGWTCLEVLCHLRDYEALFLQRARLTAEQDRPELPNPDPDALAREGRYNEQDSAQVFADWKQRRAATLAYLEALSDNQWARVAQHPRRGPMRLDDQIALVAWHDVNHAEQMARILHEKR